MNNHEIEDLKQKIDRVIFKSMNRMIEKVNEDNMNGRATSGVGSIISLESRKASRKVVEVLRDQLNQDHSEDADQ